MSISTKQLDIDYVDIWIRYVKYWTKLPYVKSFQESQTLKTNLRVLQFNLENWKNCCFWKTISDLTDSYILCNYLKFNIVADLKTVLKQIKERKKFLSLKNLMWFLASASKETLIRLSSGDSRSFLNTSNCI